MAIKWLYYIASNGIEMWRLQVAKNLPEITVLLLENGADKYATMKIYGGEYDTLALLTIGAHPKAVGIAYELEAMLKKLIPKTLQVKVSFFYFEIQSTFKWTQKTNT